MTAVPGGFVQTGRGNDFVYTSLALKIRRVPVKGTGYSIRIAPNSNDILAIAEVKRREQNERMEEIQMQELEIFEVIMVT